MHPASRDVELPKLLAKGNVYHRRTTAEFIVGHPTALVAELPLKVTFVNIGLL